MSGELQGEPDPWAPSPPRPDPVPAARRPRPLLFVAGLLVGSGAVYYGIGLSSAAWAVGHDDDDVAGLARIVLLPLLVVLAVLAGAVAVGLLVTAAAQTRPLLAAGRKPLLLLWLLPLAAAAAWPLRALT